jgi:hypothetical protein
MNEASREIVDRITANLPRISCTLSQEEADAIKEYIQKQYFQECIQAAVHSGWTRSDIETVCQ